MYTSSHITIESTWRMGFQFRLGVKFNFLFITPFVVPRFLQLYCRYSDGLIGCFTKGIELGIITDLEI